MEKDAKIRIQYSAKYQGISNSWKKWQGEIKGLQRLDALDKKLDFENEFKKWAQENGKWENEYQPVFDNFKTLYATYKDYIKPSDYNSEIVFRGIELFSLASQFNTLINNLENKQNEIVELSHQLGVAVNLQP